MKFSKMKVLGACCLLALAAGVTSAHAADAKVCDTSPTQEFTGIGQYTNGDGSTIQNLCYAAIQKGNQAFDKAIDQTISNRLVITALDTMSKDAATNPEAKKLLEIYREARSEFTNGYLKENNLNTLPTANSGRRVADNFAPLAEDFKLKTLTAEKLEELRGKFTTQAKKSINYSIN